MPARSSVIICSCQKMSKFLANSLLRFVILVLAVAAIGFSYDPVLIGLNRVPNTVGLMIAVLAGYLGYEFLNFGSESVVAEATGIVHQHQWTPALIPGLIAFGTSLSELGFVIVSTVNNQNEILAHSIIGSDGFQLGGIFFVCVAVAKTSQWDARLLRVDLWLLSLMTLFVLFAVGLGFSRTLGILIVIAALLSVWQFLKDAPEGIFATDESSDAIAGSLYNLVTGFGLLLLGTVWFFDAIVYSGGVFGVPAFVLGIAGAVITSAGEIFTTFPLVKSGEKGLFFAAIALAGSNAFDTSFLGLSAVIRPFQIAPVAHNLLPAIVTMGLTLLLLSLTYRKTVPRWLGWIVVPIYLISFIVLAIV